MSKNIPQEGEEAAGNMRDRGRVPSPEKSLKLGEESLTQRVNAA